MSTTSQLSSPVPSAKGLGKRRERSLDCREMNDTTPIATTDASNPSKKPKLVSEAHSSEEDDDYEELYGNLPPRPPARLRATPPKPSPTWKEVYGGEYSDEDEEDEEQRPTALEPQQRTRSPSQDPQPSHLSPQATLPDQLVTVVYADCEPVYPRPVDARLRSTLSVLDVALSQSAIGKQSLAASAPYDVERAPTRLPTRSPTYSPALPPSNDQEEGAQSLQHDTASQRSAEFHMEATDLVSVLVEQNAMERAKNQRLTEDVAYYRQDADDQKVMVDKQRIALDLYRAKVGDLPTGLELDRDIHQTKVDLSTAGKRISDLEYQIECIVGIIDAYKHHPEGKAVGQAYLEWKANFQRGYEPATELDRLGHYSALLLPDPSAAPPLPAQQEYALYQQPAVPRSPSTNSHANWGTGVMQSHPQAGPSTSAQNDGIRIPDIRELQPSRRRVPPNNSLGLVNIAGTPLLEQELSDPLRRTVERNWHKLDPETRQGYSSSESSSSRVSHHFPNTDDTPPHSGDEGYGRHRARRQRQRSARAHYSRAYDDRRSRASYHGRRAGAYDERRYDGYTRGYDQHQYGAFHAPPSSYAQETQYSSSRSYDDRRRPHVDDGYSYHYRASAGYA